MNILFVCTHNRCRSILAEAICNARSKGHFKAFSAGSQPAGVVHPSTLKFLEMEGIPFSELKSQSWDDFADVDIDVVITVCDSAAGESCPLWMGNAPKVHWGLPDPSKVEGNEQDIAAAFKGVIRTIERRIDVLNTLQFEGMDAAQLKTRLQELEKL